MDIIENYFLSVSFENKKYTEIQTETQWFLYCCILSQSALNKTLRTSPWAYQQVRLLC